MVTIHQLYAMRYDLERELDGNGFSIIIEHSQEHKADIIRITYVTTKYIATLDIFSPEYYEYDSRGDDELAVSKFLDIIGKELND